MTTEFLHLQGALSSPRAASNLSKGPSPAMVLTNKRNFLLNKSIDNLWNFARILGHVLHDFSMDSCKRPIATNPYRNWQNPNFKAIFFGPCGKYKLIYMVGGLVVIVCSDIIETYHVCPNKNHHQKFHWKRIQLETCLFSNMWTRQSVNKTVNDSRISCRCAKEKPHRQLTYFTVHCSTPQLPPILSI